MKDVKKEAAKLLEELKVENPAASWKHLTTGFVVVLVVVFLSIAYFNRLTATGVVEPLGEVNFGNTPKTEPVPPEIKDKKEQLQEAKEEFVEVKDGEGLWHVAQRVCGSGEDYSTLAEANGLTIYSEVVVGQKLLKKCD